ncbi:universal stress protein [Luedemannella flava]|uniref:Universal stress protein n=1 Tax=Luedemannella flava TaxID=349316 RepID=A0ABN2LD68_9ACTN
MSYANVVVGVDGSEHGRAALRWAAREAALRGIELQVVHAYDWRVPGAIAQAGAAFAEAMREAAEEVVRLAVAEAREAAPDVQVRGMTVLGSPAAKLAAVAQPDTLTVVGNRGRGGFTSLLLGSVSQQVATHAAGPVVVVRGRDEAAGRPVVVGVDASPGSEAALGLAFDVAATRRVPLVAVRAYALGGPGSGPAVASFDYRRAEEYRLVGEQVDPWREKYPDVPAEVMAAVGHPAQVLADAAAAAQVVVVGTRGHGGVASLLLGSVGLSLLHHAEAPVLIARGDGEAVTRSAGAATPGPHAPAPR